MAQSNYDKTKFDAGRLFCSYDPDEICKNRNLKRDGDYLYLTYFGEDYRVRLADGYVEKFVGEGILEADFNAAMTIYDLLCHSSEEIVMSGNFVYIPNLSRVQNATSFAGHGIYKNQEDILTGKCEALKTACEKLLGVPLGKGDVSYRIPVFQNVDILLSFWDADDEFPASLKMYVDDRLLNYMYYETVWYMTGSLMQRVMKFVEKE